MLDTGPLVALLVGQTDRSKLGSRRVQEYNDSMFDRLFEMAFDSDFHVSVPNVLTEVSNHIGSGHQHITAGIVNALGSYIRCIDEIYQPSSDIVSSPAYKSMGITDTAILSISPKLIRDRVNVVTQDHELYNRLTQVDVTCTNVMHWRTPASRL